MGVGLLLGLVVGVLFGDANTMTPMGTALGAVVGPFLAVKLPY